MVLNMDDSFSFLLDLDLLDQSYFFTPLGCCDVEGDPGLSSTKTGCVASPSLSAGLQEVDWNWIQAICATAQCCFQGCYPTYRWAKCTPEKTVQESESCREESHDH